MTAVVIGTAGHVDHGKTALVEALTGVNTDRWEEERARGLTIDLGFAPLETDGVEISIVDAPGHEDFVKNMLAGAGGIDLLLLVVAADEGPMPQTREHLWIARFLDIRRGIVALTKSDLVDAELLELATDATRDALSRVYGELDWPVVPVSARTGAGVEKLRALLESAARTCTPRPVDDLLRLPVDRSFTVRGVGTVVTGTVWSGRIRQGDQVRILPAERSARVRSIERHGRHTEEARAGQRAGLALAGLDTSEIARGDLVVREDVWRATERLDALIHVAPDARWPLTHWQRVRFHLGAAEALCRVVLLEDAPLPPGTVGLAQLRLERPVVARGLDRFVLRFYSPVTTIGGGLVVDPWPPRRTRLESTRAAAMHENVRGPVDARVAAAIGRSPMGAKSEELAVRVGAGPSKVRAALESLAGAGSARNVQDRWFAAATADAMREELLSLLARGHREAPDEPGLNLESLRSAAAGSPQLADAVLEDLSKEGKVRLEGPVAALSRHEPALGPEQRRIGDALCERLQGAGLKPPTIGQLADELGIERAVLLPILKFLERHEEVVAVTPDLYFDADAVQDARTAIRGFLSDAQPAAPGDFRDLLGVSRRHLIPLLEYLDETGTTRRTPRGRVLSDAPGAGQA